MWLHILTAYSIISLAIMEIAMADKIGSQDNRIKRISFYIGGLIVGPPAALYGVYLGIKKTWE